MSRALRRVLKSLSSFISRPVANRWQFASLLKCLVVLAALSATAASAVAQDHWRQFIIRSQAEYNAGIIGGDAEQHMHGITRCANYPDIIYLSHDCNQVWISRDNGDSWQRTTCEGMRVSGGQGIAVDPVNPDKLIIIMDSSFNYRLEDVEGIYVSDDAGESWQFVQPALGESLRHYQASIDFDPTCVTDEGAQRWYAARATNALFVSEDGGYSWDALANLSAHSDVYSLKCHIYDGQTLYMGSNQGLYVSHNRGVSFSEMGNLPSGEVSSISLHPTDANIMYVNVRGSGLYKSTNAGASFTRIYYSNNSYYGIINPGYPDKIFLSFGDGDIRVSNNGGATWSRSDTYNSIGEEINTELDGAMTSISPDPRDPDICTTYSHARCWKTFDGIDFHWANTRLTGFNSAWWQDVAAFDVGDPDRFVFFCFDVGQVMTENGGLWFHHRPVPWNWYSSGQLSWISIHSGDLYPETGSGILMMAAGGTFNLKLVRSTDFGITKNIVDHREFTHLITQFNRNNPQIVYSGNKRSINTGQSFSEIDLLAENGGTIVGIAPSNNDIVYAMDGTEHTIYRSDDTGLTWTIYVETSWRMGGLDSRPCGFTVHPTNPDWIYTMNSKGRLSRFDGTSWTDMNLPVLEDVPGYRAEVGMIHFDPRYPDIIYVEYGYTGGPQIYRTTDGGSSWQDITFNLPRDMGGLKVHPLTGDVIVSSCCGSFIMPAPYADPNSIYENATPDAPVAVLNLDRVIRDTDGDGRVTLMLDAGESYSVETTISLYNWEVDGQSKGNGSRMPMSLDVGEHTIKLSVMDNYFVSAYDVAKVTVVSSAPGDANGDGSVDLDDFIILKQNYGTGERASWETGDFNDDGYVDLDDFIILKQNYGS